MVFCRFKSLCQPPPPLSPVSCSPMTSSQEDLFRRTIDLGGSCSRHGKSQVYDKAQSKDFLVIVLCCFATSCGSFTKTCDLVCAHPLSCHQQQATTPVATKDPLETLSCRLCAPWSSFQDSRRPCNSSKLILDDLGFAPAEWIKTFSSRSIIAWHFEFGSLAQRWTNTMKEDSRKFQIWA